MVELKAAGDSDAYSRIDSLLKMMTDDARQTVAVLDSAVQDVMGGAGQDRAKLASQGIDDYLTRMRRELRSIEDVKLPSDTGLREYRSWAVIVARTLFRFADSLRGNAGKVQDLAYEMKRLKEV